MPYFPWHVWRYIYCHSDSRHRLQYDVVYPWITMWKIVGHLLLGRFSFAIVKDNLLLLGKVKWCTFTFSRNSSHDKKWYNEQDRSVNSSLKSVLVSCHLWFLNYTSIYLVVTYRWPFVNKFIPANQQMIFVIWLRSLTNEQTLYTTQIKALVHLCDISWHALT